MVPVFRFTRVQDCNAIAYVSCLTSTTRVQGLSRNGGHTPLLGGAERLKCFPDDPSNSNPACNLQSKCSLASTSIPNSAQVISASAHGTP